MIGVLSLSNHEKKYLVKSVHMLMAFARPSHGCNTTRQCIRTVDYGRGDEVDVLEAKLKVIGGYWRIHRTVNKRDCEKARKWTIKHLIDFPEKASMIDSVWRTALMQKDCIYEDKMFMLDVDTQDKEKLYLIRQIISVNNGAIVEEYTSPKGFHIITLPFDTREVCKLEYVTLLRDGYYFIKEVGERKET